METMKTYGMIDLHGNWVVQPKYQNLGSRTLGISTIRLHHGSVGYLFSNGEEFFIKVTDLTSLSAFTGIGTAEFETDDHGFIDLKGIRFGKRKYESLSPNLNGAYHATEDCNAPTSGVVDLQENWIVPPVYAQVNPLVGWGYQCFLPIELTEEELETAGPIQQYCHWFDLNGKQLCPHLPLFELLSSDDPFVVVYHEASNGPTSSLYHSNGQEIQAVPSHILHRYGFSNGLAPACFADNLDQYGYVNMNYEWVIAPQFSEASTFSKWGTAIVKTKNSYGIIRRDGSYIIPPHYRFSIRGGNCGRYIFQDNRTKKYGAFDILGNLVIPPTLDYLSPFYEGVSVASP
ncbi:WG repeat-containing protein [Tuwongella immobilis]|uniref:Uncharacterized protein n=1 Tax=Tuwongella immobilis TaxID=692036 RepID=A0A6C2YX30_9BACT|nr:WG repeat-containing protein [Tuwongella immobilis]VIP05392.1 kwg repeat protein : Uncharacterized protein OS=Peptostreptococcaceae bacterium AS15 GN=HMPREF1142_1017 PE=4 SV=1: WG_beta_rep: WG_beta_rep: WG_beta_rep: WG_beta_rep [Tuwongella immobilis]VTS08140.1 kwg repeat protein : Uncharacterized protein OS=Peptostreptococcaceae bacterium AS15 GN=HMPREF1142_1017 PE=4 SV=1: WG_beta_rep: WG_beta_rep: WG_beta_rep: WG_beta_rep [Tuwongella immobilis]